MYEIQLIVLGWIAGYVTARGLSYLRYLRTCKRLQQATPVESASETMNNLLRQRD